jgi:hypothetical protein
VNTNMNTNMVTATSTSSADTKHRRPPRTAEELAPHLPDGWLVSVHELGTDTSAKVRVRVLVFEHSYFGFRLLPVTTRKKRITTKTDEGVIEVEEDFDLLPRDPLGFALPAHALVPVEVLENFTILLAEYGKKAAAIPPPSKRPVTHRPFNPKTLRKVAGAQVPKPKHVAAPEPKGEVVVVTVPAPVPAQEQCVMAVPDLELDDLTQMISVLGTYL